MHTHKAFSLKCTKPVGRDFAAGFTLLELLVVLVILGLLVGYVAPKYFAQIGKSEVKTARAQINSLEKALDQYRLDTGHYPAAGQGLAALFGSRNIDPTFVACSSLL